MSDRTITDENRLPQQKADALDNELAELIQRAQERLDAHEEGDKKGPVWHDDHPKYHIEKAHGELGMAGYHARQPDHTKDDVQTELADALNHILFALALEERRN